MPPIFKKPLEYDPSLAERTLQHTYNKSEAAQEAKKKSFLAELGLADEEYNLTDEDDDMQDEDDPDHFMRNTGASGTGIENGSATKYNYKDLFGKEFEKRRRQLIEVKGYDKYFSDLLARSNESLQALRQEVQLQYPGNVEIIPELQHELEALLKELKSNERGSVQAKQDDGGQLRELKQVLEKMRSDGEEKDQHVAGLQEKIRFLENRIASNTREGQYPDLSPQLEQAQLALSKKDEHITRLSRQIESLQAETNNAAAIRSRETDEALRRLQEENEELRKRLSGSSAERSASSAEVEALHARLSQLAAEHEAQVVELKADIAQKDDVITQMRHTKSDALAQMKEMSAKAKQAKVEAVSEVKGQMEAMYAKLDELHMIRESVLEELVSFRSDIFNEKTLLQMSRLVRDKEISSLKKMQGDSRQKIAQMEAHVAETQRELADKREMFDQQLRIREIETQSQVDHYRERWRVEFERRKKLHNLVSELKGNIRVICRVRPLLPRELHGLGAERASAHLPLHCASEEVLRITTDKGEKDFEFDRVFALQDGQEKVYDEVSGLVTSTLDGYNVSIMAYGQTGSGKTYTMEGPDAMPGVNMRALSDLFRIADERKDELKYSFSASVLEIYNENIFDLLAGGGASGGKDHDKDHDKLDVKQGPDGMYVPGLRVEEVADLTAVQQLIQLGKNNRSTFATNMNEHSSRSHLVLSVYVKCINKITGVALRGKLHLIDLAGSERLSRTGAQGDRLKEAQAINKSLAALGDVISALQQRSPHIPYRNSKLTRLLEDSLGGNSKCVMIVNVSPAAENAGESKCSLEFASRARKVELGRAKQNVISLPNNGGSGGSGNGSGGGGSGTGSGTGSGPGNGGLSMSMSSSDLGTSSGGALPHRERLASARPSTLEHSTSRHAIASSNSYSNLRRSFVK